MQAYKIVFPILIFVFIDVLHFPLFQNTAGQTTLSAFVEHDFRANFTSNSTIRIEFTGPTDGFYVNITQFTLCMTPSQFDLKASFSKIC